MRILFVSSVAAGGSGVSQQQLALRLAARGHEVEMLAAADDRGFVRRLYERQVDLSTRLRGNVLRPMLLTVQRPWGQRLRPGAVAEYPTWVSAVPENGYRTLRRRARPDVVVASSIDRVTWRRLRSQLQADNIPSVLYIREASALGHLTISEAPPTLLLANAESHAARARAEGFECDVVPSVVELDRSRTDTSRRTALVVNPSDLLGGDRIWPIADARADIPFVLQESGLLSDRERSGLHALAASRPNVTIRPYTDNPAEVYRDARVLLVPHRVDNRPRVILEAQANGIPVIASAFPGLAESIGPGGIIVEDADNPAAWTRALSNVWDDPTGYEFLVGAARAHANRPEVDVHRIVDRFEELLTRLTNRTVQPRLS